MKAGTGEVMNSCFETDLILLFSPASLFVLLSYPDCIVCIIRKLKLTETEDSLCARVWEAGLVLLPGPGLQGSVENSVVLAALVEVLIMDRYRHRACANMAERA